MLAFFRFLSFFWWEGGKHRSPPPPPPHTHTNTALLFWWTVTSLDNSWCYLCTAGQPVWFEILVLHWTRAVQNDKQVTHLATKEERQHASPKQQALTFNIALSLLSHFSTTGVKSWTKIKKIEHMQAKVLILPLDLNPFFWTHNTQNPHFPSAKLKAIV